MSSTSSSSRSFCGSAKGAESGATVYSLVETAKANGVDPYGYLLLVVSMLLYLGKSPLMMSWRN